MDSKECTKCIHEVVCESAKSCDGRVPGCKHFKEEQRGIITVQEWISVKDRLPEEHGIYQIFGYDKDCDRTKVWYGCFFGYNWLVYAIDGDGKRFDVTHWMPMPQPPKGE